MGFAPSEIGEDAAPMLEEVGSSTARWQPLFQHECHFDRIIFKDVMMNLIKNPNINTSWLFRADILHDHEYDCLEKPPAGPLADDFPPEFPQFKGFGCQRAMVRKLIPRNTQRDKPLDQTCLFFESRSPIGDIHRSLVVYLPHVSSESEMPFYHPKVRGIGFLHEWTPAIGSGSVSIHFHSFDGGSSSSKQTRTALNLLSVLHKHGEGRLKGYTKRVHHDVLVPQAVFQDRYSMLKGKYARILVTGWLETTDPGKHVFEDLGIAAFLIELWTDMYKGATFPGFVDIGCGNGLLVHLLNEEGYHGWGFDARSRRSWGIYNKRLESSSDNGGTFEDSLRQLVLLPSAIKGEPISASDAEVLTDKIHDGTFQRGAFIISNHADELTPWTPILATASDCPFIMIPCCSHNLTGAKWRAPPPKHSDESSSTYASLVAWVSNIARDCGWDVEKEMLRIPSTRNAAIVGRKRSMGSSGVRIADIIEKHGGAEGYCANVVKLLKAAPAGH